MRVLLALLVVLVLALAGLLVMMGNPLELLREREAATAELPSAPAPADSGVVAASGTPGDATPPPVVPQAPAAVASADEPAAVEAEARRYLRTLAEPEPEPVAAARADHFVGAEQMITMLPDSAVETTTLGELKADASLQPNTPITVVRTIEQVEASTPARVIAHSGGDLDARVRVLDDIGGEVRETTVRKVLEAHRMAPERPIMLVREVEHLEVTTLEELEAEMRRADSADAGHAVQGGAAARGGEMAEVVAMAGEDQATPQAGASSVKVARGEGGARPPAQAGRLPLMQRTVRVVRAPALVTEATVKEILQSRDQSVEPGSIFYVRTVQRGDEQGIWGIVHHGIIDNFARGVAIRRGEVVDTYRVDIPFDADELELDRSSSFLGRLIYDKASESHVYNYRLNRMGQNPDTIFPGQELVIIQFRPSELVSIYRHFVEQPG